jgi:hypothetical protein
MQVVLLVDSTCSANANLWLQLSQGFTDTREFPAVAASTMDYDEPARKTPFCTRAAFEGTAASDFFSKHSSFELNIACASTLVNFIIVS